MNDVIGMGSLDPGSTAPSLPFNNSAVSEDSHGKGKEVVPGKQGKEAGTQEQPPARRGPHGFHDLFPRHRAQDREQQEQQEQQGKQPEQPESAVAPRLGLLISRQFASGLTESCASCASCGQPATWCLCPAEISRTAMVEAAKKKQTTSPPRNNLAIGTAAPELSRRRRQSVAVVAQSVAVAEAQPERRKPAIRRPDPIAESSPEPAGIRAVDMAKMSKTPTLSPPLSTSLPGAQQQCGVPLQGSKLCSRRRTMLPLQPNNSLVFSV